MAAPIPSPTPAPNDLVTLRQALALLRRSPYPASESTLKRWISRYRIQRRRIGRADYVSFSDVVIAQRQAARERQEQREP